ncbi:DegV family protein [Lacticaseibacillus hulanensis]|uniref:DegV family protein n=1 Tax=Lacticaseibacillus hulanensis TaxID=2493111 RepID=UPI000FD7529A|nr:DegV family protein [Lacticaseibacillus hulanensis]
MGKIAVIVDSGSDVPQSVLVSHANIAVVPLTVTFGGREYHDGVDLTPTAFYEYLETADELPKTASPAPFAVTAKMQELLDAGYTHIIGVTIASALSATYQTFKLAAADLPAGTVEVLDSKSVGIGSGLQAVYALDLIDEGVPFADIVLRVQASIAKSHVYFYVPSLKYLAAGGRIGRVAGLLGGLLKVKPVISCADDGVYYVVGKSRSEAKAMKNMVDLVAADFAGGRAGRIAVAHGANPELLSKVADALANATDHPVDYRGDISPSLGVHTGPGLIGVGVQIV